MQYYLVAPTQITHAAHDALTYHYDAELAIGSIVRIPLGKRMGAGVVLSASPQPEFKTRAISDLLEDRPLPLPLLDTARWMGEYYATHLAVVLQTLLPRGLGKARRVRTNLTPHPIRDRTSFVLNKAQQAAFTTIITAPPGTIMVRGVTGSGKTWLYIEAARDAYQRGQSAIILVPEIALTAQLVAEFSAHFPRLLVTHSTMSEAQRHVMWRECLGATEPLIVIGPRSALFSPLPNLGLIIIDECHEPSYKQEQSPRYSALRAASVLAAASNARLVLGSATPAIVDMYLAEKAERPIALLPQPARHDAVKPTVTLVDMTKQTHFSRHRFLSNELIKEITTALSEHRQSLIFHNRRGSAPITLCEHCGWTAACPQCFLPLTLHTDRHQLKCHVCGFGSAVPPHCPECHEPDVVHKGIGTKLVTEELAKLFPQARIERFDADTLRTEALHHRYQALYDGEIDIIVGTQIIAKGLDLPKLRTVGVVQADGGLSLPDYQSAERVFQLIYQVCGRVGRSKAVTHAVVQTYQPTHPSVTYGVTQNYEGFYDFAVRERQRAGFPPFSHLLKLTCIYASEAPAVRASRAVADIIRRELGDSVRILGPAPSFYERLNGKYRWQLVLRSADRRSLLRAITLLPPGPHWQYDIDPANLL